MPIRNVPLWLDRYPKSRRPSYSRFRGELETDVVIVGGGLTGCACAWAFAGAGVKTILLEADSIGRGGTAESAGLIREDFDASFRENALAHGLRASRTMWQMMRRASLDFSAAIRRLGVRCDLASSDYLTITRAYSGGARLLQREHQSRREAGLEHSWLKPAAVNREAAVESGGAIRTHGFTFDPYRACVGFAAAASTRGAVLHEDSPVRRIRAGRKQVVGKPVLYKTTKDFLLQFGLKDLAELPTLKEFEEWSRLALGDDAGETPKEEPKPEPEAEPPPPPASEQS